MNVYLDTDDPLVQRVYVVLDDGDTIHMIDSDGGVYVDLPEVPYTARRMEARSDQTAE